MGFHRASQTLRLPALHQHWCCRWRAHRTPGVGPFWRKRVLKFRRTNDAPTSCFEDLEGSDSDLLVGWLEKKRKTYSPNGRKTWSFKMVESVKTSPLTNKRWEMFRTPGYTHTHSTLDLKWAMWKLTWNVDWFVLPKKLWDEVKNSVFEFIRR